MFSEMTPKAFSQKPLAKSNGVLISPMIFSVLEPEDTGNQDTLPPLWGFSGQVLVKE